VSATQLDLFAVVEPELADQAARDTAISRIDTSFVVSAGAGAGKTETLIRRLERALDAEVDPNRIVAITFTERAARDLVNKLRAKLPPRLVPSVEQMTVGTIHSFCLGILRRHPLEAGLPPVFATQDELLAGTDAHDRAVRIHHALFERIEQLDDPVLRDAIDVIVADNGITHLPDLIALVDQQWDRFEEIVVDPPGSWQDACRRVLDEVRANAFDPSTPAALREKLVAMLPSFDTFLAAPTMAAAFANLPPSSGQGSAGGGAAKELRQHHVALIKSLPAILRDNALRRLLHVLVPLVLDEAHQRYRSGSVSFDDILVLTRRLLARRPDICARLRAEIDHLCVDEFQDTDAVQYDIVQALTVPGEGHTPVLFAVGDPKQSIYGFREADVALFAQLHQLDHLEPLQLTTNFRSRPAVLRWINTWFRSWFDADPGQVPFAPLDHHVPESPATVAVVGRASDASAEQVARDQARDIARVIGLAHDSWLVRRDGGERPAAYADMAVLVRTRSDLTHLEPALRRAGIPYVVEGGALLYDTREVRELLRVLAAVNDTASPIKVVTALRTSVLGISDVELVAHRNAGGRWQLDVEAGSDAGGGHPAVLAALGLLRGWRDARHRTPVPELLAEIARRTAARAASLVDGAPTTTWRRLRFVLDEARWWYEQTGGSVGEYLQWVAMRVDEADRSNVTSDETDEDAVHILTIHAAKGLEFPVVLVAGLGRQRPGGANVRASFVPDASGVPELRLKMGKLATLGFTSVDEREADRLEAARLAYVACTRAMDHLVVCMHHGRRSSGNSAAEAWGYLPPTDDLPDLGRAPRVPAPPVAELSDQLDRPPARATRWVVRSSWSATQLRHRDDDAPVAVPAARPAPVTSVDETGFDDTGFDDTGFDDLPPLPDDLPPLPDDPGESVHSKPARSFAALPDQIGRYGTRVGRAVHGVVQMVPFDDPFAGVDERIAEQCRAEDVPERFHPYVGLLVRSILTSDAFARMVAASRIGTVRREMYVGAEVERDGVTEGVYGIIDAVWREPDGFVVVDVKTDHVLEPPEVLAQRYRVQLQAYAAALTAATGIAVAETLLCVALPDGSPAITVVVPR
jgi:ATP-dependent helicase/nuclease subunit A